MSSGFDIVYLRSSLINYRKIDLRGRLSRVRSWRSKKGVSEDRTLIEAFHISNEPSPIERFFVYSASATRLAGILLARGERPREFFANFH